MDDRYFEWLCSFIRIPTIRRYCKLLHYLHSVSFRFTIRNDENRFEDGIELRYRYIYDNDYVELPLVDTPCTVFEMMVALVIRAEEHIMSDPDKGDRTSMWFWGMVKSLGLLQMKDDRFDIIFVKDTINRFLDRQYEPDGRGGLFTIQNCRYDLREIEIWYQMNWKLDEYI